MFTEIFPKFSVKVMDKMGTSKNPGDSVNDEHSEATADDLEGEEIDWIL